MTNTDSGAPLRTDAVEPSTGIAPLRWLTLCGAGSAGLYGVVTYLSWRFDYGSPTQQRPILAVLAVFAVLFLIYLAAIRFARQARQDRHLLAVIIGGAVLLRVVVLFSLPIQEVDIYRYLWDGAVVNAGIDPFAYSPQQVREAEATTADSDLRFLVALRDDQPPLAEILSRVHYGELTTIYPPVSQAAFAAAVAVTPRKASVLARVRVMKALLILFDLATLLLVVQLLRFCRRPIGLSLIYGWCPLLLKEVANSGHLDAIAVFFTTLAILLVVRFCMAHSYESAKPGIRRSWSGDLLTAVVLAVAVGTKLYPVVLAPLVLLTLRRRLGWRRCLASALVFLIATAVLTWPMLPHRSTENAVLDGTIAEAAPPPSGPKAGIATFLRRWEMNDFLFLLVVENLKPTADLNADQTAWFSVLPDGVRRSLMNAVTHLGVSAAEAPFLVARAATGGVFVLVALMLAFRGSRDADPARFCEAAFLTLAWFWLLSPTQNPWYWTWALPLLPFAKGRAWLAVSGLVLLYYLRFWFSYHWPTTPVPGTPYIGATFFDFVVTWAEYAPWFVWLAVAAVLRSHRRNHAG